MDYFANFTACCEKVIQIPQLTSAFHLRIISELSAVQLPKGWRCNKLF